MKRLAVITVVLALLLFTIFGSYHDPLRIQPDVSLAMPGTSFWFGADRLGRDMFGRTGRALGNTLADAGLAEMMSLAFCLTVALLALSGRRGWLLSVLDVVLAALRSVPAFLPAFAIAALFRQNALAVPAALVLLSVIYSLPVYLAEIKRASDSPFVEGSIALGASWFYTATRCILPEALPRILRFAAVDLASLVAFAALLGAVGLNQPPEPNLGQLIFDGRTDILDHYWLFWAPTAVLVITLTTVWLIASDPHNMRPYAKAENFTKNELTMRS
jgi:peptide/nickel transport system permease protein